jgi:hypothetical protein
LIKISFLKKKQQKIRVLIHTTYIYIHQIIDLQGTNRDLRLNLIFFPPNMAQICPGPLFCACGSLQMHPSHGGARRPGAEISGPQPRDLRADLS